MIKTNILITRYKHIDTTTFSLDHQFLQLLIPLVLSFFPIPKLLPTPFNFKFAMLGIAPTTFLVLVTPYCIYPSILVEKGHPCPLRYKNDQRNLKSKWSPTTTSKHQTKLKSSRLTLCEDNSRRLSLYSMVASICIVQPITSHIQCK